MRARALVAWARTVASGSCWAILARASVPSKASGPRLSRASTAVSRTAASRSLSAPMRAGIAAGSALPTWPRLATAFLRDFASVARAHRPESKVFRAIGRDASDKAHGAIAEQQVHAVQVPAGKIVQAAVRVGFDVDPVVMHEDQTLRRADGALPRIACTRP